MADTCLHVRAYERKEEMGGGFRCVVSRGAQRLFSSEVRESQVDAFRDGYDFVMDFAGSRAVSVGHYRSDRFRKNYFISNA